MRYLVALVLSCRVRSWLPVLLPSALGVGERKPRAGLSLADARSRDEDACAYSQRVSLCSIRLLLYAFSCFVSSLSLFRGGLPCLACVVPQAGRVLQAGVDSVLHHPSTSVGVPRRRAVCELCARPRFLVQPPRALKLMRRQPRGWGAVAYSGRGPVRRSCKAHQALSSFLELSTHR